MVSTVVRAATPEHHTQMDPEKQQSGTRSSMASCSVEEILPMISNGCRMLSETSPLAAAPRKSVVNILKAFADSLRMNMRKQ